MSGTACRQAGYSALLVLNILVGCSPSAPKGALPADDEGPVRETFVSFQAALKAKDADKIWPLLDADSQADAERAAKALQASYAAASPEARADQEKALGLPGAELAALTGRTFLKSNRFAGRYDELSNGKIDRITVQGDKATVYYVEPDGDKEKLNLVRQDSRWKLSLPMPRVTSP